MKRNRDSFRTTLDELILHFEQVNNGDLTAACNYCCDQAAAAEPGSDARMLWLELGRVVVRIAKDRAAEQKALRIIEQGGEQMAVKWDLPDLRADEQITLRRSVEDLEREIRKS